MWTDKKETPQKKEEETEDTYQLVDIPAAVLAALLGVGHALVHAEVPVHVGRLLAAAVLGGLEAAAALGARRAEVFVEAGEEVWAEAGGSVSLCCYCSRRRWTHVFNEVTWSRGFPGATAPASD